MLVKFRVLIYLMPQSRRVTKIMTTSSNVSKIAGLKAAILKGRVRVPTTLTAAEVQEITQTEVEEDNN